jgi:transposase
MMRIMKPYSEDLRLRIVRAVRGGTPKSTAARLFDVSLSSVKRYLRIAERGASLAPKKGGWKTAKDRPDHGETPPRGRRGAPGRATVSERRRFLEGTTGKALSDSPP